MAEFVQMLKDWKRMCNAMTAMDGCEDCPIVKNTHNARCGDMPGEMQDIESIAREVEKWAAEHPEPVYPRWCDWLAEQGVLVCDNSFPNMRYWYAMNKEKMEQPIPADIAKKLGLQPKEGTC